MCTDAGCDGLLNWEDGSPVTFGTGFSQILADENSVDCWRVDVTTSGVKIADKSCTVVYKTLCEIVC